MKIFPFVCLLPWGFLLVPASAEVVINEIMFNIPRGENVPEATEEEFIEIWNTGADPVDLSGWEIDAGVTFAFPETTLGANRYLVIAASPEAFAQKYPSVTSAVLGPWTGRLSNSGEKIRLRDQGGEEVDELTYSDQGDWASRRRGPLQSGHRGWVWESSADGGGGSLELVNPELSNREGQNWRATASGGETPGAINGSFSPDEAPMILKVRHSPAIPTPSDEVVVTADLRDVAGDEITASISFGSNSNSPSDRTVLAMSDDGANGDGDAGDGIFGATLPAFPAGSVVDFFIKAGDGNLTRTWPGPSDEAGSQEANALFQVEEIPFESDQELTTYRLILSPDENEEFAFENFNRASNAQMNATFIARLGDDTDIRYLAGIRRRGAGSRSRNPRTMRLTLAGDRPWQDTTRMNLNARYNYLQLFGQKMFAASRLPSAKARPVELLMNGVDQANQSDILYGAYVHLEPQGGDSVARQFPDDSSGNLYSKRRPNNELAFRDGEIADYQSDGWSKSTNSSEANWTDLDDWLAAIQNTDDPDYFSNLEKVMDIDQWVRWFGVMTLLGNSETNISNGADDDYYVYGGRLDPRIKAVPHDLDTILGLGDGSAVSNPELTIYDMIERGDSIPALIPLMREPSVVQRYHLALRDLIEGPFSTENFDELLTNCLGNRVPPTVLTGMISYMDARRAFVLSEVNPALSVSTNLPLVGDLFVSSNARPSLSGRVNLSEAASVSVNGQPAQINHANGTWTIGDSSLNEVSYLDAGATWSYLDDGSNQGTAWREVGFDDSAWKSAEGEFGYGDGDETTQILYGPNGSNLINFFTNRNNKFITTYFRKVIDIQDPTIHQDFSIRLKRDAGAAVYVNGVRQILDNLADNATFGTVAETNPGDSDEGTFFPFAIPVTAFVAGANTIAVEVHNAAPDNDDLSFDLSLNGRSAPPVGLSFLNPGLNRVIVEARDAEGALLETSSLDIFYDDGESELLSGTLGNDTILRAEDGPFFIESDLFVPVGVTLTIEEGACLLFGQDVSLTVFGRLDAQGSVHQRIQLGVRPGSGDTWRGLIFANSPEDNRMSFLDQNFATSGDHSIEVNRSRLTLNQVRWRGTTETVLEVTRPQMEVRNCDFPSSSGNEVIHGTDLSGEEYFNLIGNVFQTSSGYNDIVDFSGGRRPGPIIYVINNIFEGGTDDCLDLDGIDAHIEGNIFWNIHTDDPGRSSTSNAIATDGDAHLTVVRNVFDDVDHALLLKNESDAIFENNIVRNASLGAISFREPLRDEVDAGSDLFCRGNIFVGNAVTFRFPDHPREGGGLPNIVADHNILPTAEHSFGVNNLDADPAFFDAEQGDFRLLPGSSAMGTGINGQDMGAAVPQGASVAGEPPALTDETSATLTVHMAGISGIESGTFTSEYRWRLNDGPWSEDTGIEEPIALTGLTPGTYQVSVLGKDSDGVWQIEPNFSESWTVVEVLPPSLRINEVVANRSEGNDWVELYNSGSSAVDLSGLVLSDDASGTPGTIFAAGSELGPKSFLQVDLGADFSLDREGESLFLLLGDAVIDSVNFGHQPEDHSLSRLGRAGAWGLAEMTPASANVAIGMGDVRLMKINEWLANPRVVICDDFVELYNPGQSPLALGGLLLSENPGGEIAQYVVPDLTFVEAGGFVALDFSMNSDSRSVALYQSDFSEIDLVAFTSQVEDSSYIRVPDGGALIQDSDLPTPGMSNGNSRGTTSTTFATLVELNANWSYDDAGVDRGTAWREVDFDDSGWASGPGLLGFEEDDLPEPGLQTQLVDPDDNDPFIPTYYFRSEFSFDGDPASTELFLTSIFDDGGVVYLNGEPLYRQGIDENPDFGTFANGGGEAEISGPSMVPSGELVKGVNVIAAEIHQADEGSSDFVFGMKLDSVETVFTPSEDLELIAAVQLLQNLRITEVMYDPAEGTEFEFIELQNIGNVALELEGVRFVDGIQFVFPQMTLAPGDWVLLVNDLESFEGKYGAGLPVAGEYSGKLSNGGEELVLQLPEPFSGNIQKFTYNDSWYPESDGNGASLEIINSAGAVREWDSRLSWRAGPINGTPGTSLTLGAGSPQVVLVNETATLNGMVGGNWTPSLLWSQVSGPASSTISSGTTISPGVTFILPGTYRFRLTATEGATELTSEVTVAVDDRYELWAARNSLTGEVGDDNDGDGVINLMEYALDLDPLLKNGPVLSEVIEGQFSYHKFLRKSDLIYQLETSDDLENWNPDPGLLLNISPDRQLRAFSLSGDGREFVRLRVIR